MSAEKTPPVRVPCLCNALRQASRAVSRLYDEELRGVGLRTTQLSLLEWLRRSGEVRRRDLAGLTLHDETSLTRSLRPLVEARWVAVRTGNYTKVNPSRQRRGQGRGSRARVMAGGGGRSPLPPDRLAPSVPQRSGERA